MHFWSIWLISASLRKMGKVQLDKNVIELQTLPNPFVKDFGISLYILFNDVLYSPAGSLNTYLVGYCPKFLSYIMNYSLLKWYRGWFAWAFHFSYIVILALPKRLICWNLRSMWQYGHDDMPISKNIGYRHIRNRDGQRQSDMLISKKVGNEYLGDVLYYI